MVSVELECGVLADLDGLHCWKTYGGLLEGVPNLAMNRRLIGNALETADFLWPGVPIHLVLNDGDVATRSLEELIGDAIGDIDWFAFAEPFGF